MPLEPFFQGEIGLFTAQNGFSASVFPRRRAGLISCLKLCYRSGIPLLNKIMPVEFKGPAIVIDVETTGTFPDRDQVIEFGYKLIGKATPAESIRIKPQVRVSPQASAVHGIRDEDLINCLPFSDRASQIRSLFEGTQVVVGYNVEFDIEFIEAEFRRLKQPPLLLHRKTLIDPLRLWRRAEPRRLQDAVRRFAAGKTYLAHSAAGDVTATEEVLNGMLMAFSLNELTWEELEAYVSPERASQRLRIGPSDHIRWQEKRAIVFFGKHKGFSVYDIARKEQGYCSFVMERDFPNHVKEIFRAAVKAETEEEFCAELRRTYCAEGS